MGEVIPVLGVPVLNRYDLLERMLPTINVPVDVLAIVDNGGGLRWRDIHPLLQADVGELRLIQPGANLGVAASWNLVIRTNLDAPWIAFTAADVELGPTALPQLAELVASNPTGYVHNTGGWSLVAFTSSAIDRVGWFDESYHPAYCEDADWTWRARLAGVLELEDTIDLHEGGSVTIREDGTDNVRTYPDLVAYHIRKWGGPPWHEVYREPFNGAPVQGPSPAWLRAQSW